MVDVRRVCGEINQGLQEKKSCWRAFILRSNCLSLSRTSSDKVNREFINRITVTLKYTDDHLVIIIINNNERQEEQ